MKTVLKYTYIVAAGLLLAGCQNEEPLADGARQVHMSVGISKDMALSRSELHEQEGNLLSVWSAGDQVLVTDDKGNKLGVLYVHEGAGESHATFAGDLLLNQQGEV